MSDPTEQRRSHDLYEEDSEEFLDSRVVRPYALTKGRTRPDRGNLPLEALVRSIPDSVDPVGTRERKKILELTSESILSVAELSAHLSLPLGVVRVLVSDLADENLVVVHTGSLSSSAPANNLKVLESVLNGISAL